MERIKVGFASISTPLLKEGWPQEILDRSLKRLGTLPFQLVPAMKSIKGEKEAEEVANFWRQKEIDLMVIQSGTFPAGDIVPALALRVEVPIVLWATPEPPMSGGGLVANSFCGHNMNASHLWRLGKKYKYIFGWPEDDALTDELMVTVRVVSAIKKLKHTRIGQVGSRVPAYYVSNFDELSLRRCIGPRVYHIDISTVLCVAQSLAEEEVDTTINKIRTLGKLQDVEPFLENNARAYMALRKLAEELRCDGLAVKCWPEFQDSYGIVVCLAVSLLNNEGIVAGCEGDMLGTVSMILESYLSGKVSALMDLVSFDAEENTGMIFHCGACAISLANTVGGRQVCLCPQSILSGPGIAAEFTLKPGPCTLIRLSEERESGYRMLIAAGEGIETDQRLRGNVQDIRFQGSVDKLVTTIMEEGFEHHYAVVYENINEELIELCKWLDVRPIVVE